MDAVKYLKEKARMCKTIGGCYYCPFTKEVKGVRKVCGSFQKEYPEEAVKIVEKWSAEHPQKTILQDFLEKYPDARIDSKGRPVSCPVNLGYPTDCKTVKCCDCWNRPLEG